MGRPEGRFDFSRVYFVMRYRELATELMRETYRRPSEREYCERLGIDPRTLRRYRIAYDVPLGSTGVEGP